jgi:twinkle protein
MADIKVINLADKKEYTIDVHKNGENQMVCPECSANRKKKTDKCFSFNLNKGAGRCNHCGIVLVENKPFEPKRTQIEFKRPKIVELSKYTDNCLKFFKTRLISEKTLLELKVTEAIEWMPNARAEIPTIQFNYFRNGELINIKSRGKNKDFKLFKDAELIFYNLDATIDNETIIICEGEMDALAIYECGFKNVISVPNGAGLGKINFEYLDNCIDSFSDNTKFLLALDNDKAGLNLQNELARRLGFENCSKITFKDCKDANDCLIKYGQNITKECLLDAKEFPIIGVFNSHDIEIDILDYYNNGLPEGTGINMAEIDTNIRFHQGYLTMITGIPGHGKSEFLDFILCRLNLSNDNWKTAYFSPENHPLQLHFSKLAEKLIGKPFDKKSHNRLSPIDLRNAIDYCSENFYFINPEDDFTITSILKSVKELIKRKGIKSFVIDAWNKLDHKRGNKDKNDYISETLDIITKFCERNLVHCFLVAHPTKMGKDKDGKPEVPSLYNISDSAHFFNKTANGICVYRNFETGCVEIHIQKVKFKHWGQTATIHLAWDKTNGRYYKGTPSYESWINTIEATKQIDNTNFLNETSDIIINNIDIPF